MVDLAPILSATLEHLELTAAALFIATTVGVPLGAYLTRFRTLAAPVLALLGVFQTIPSLALLGLLIPLLGIGEKPTLVALTLYVLLPIVRNTFSGLDSIEASVLEAARGMGMRPRQILSKVALPLALPIVMGGIRTSTVMCVGLATLAALVGAGGLGRFIFRGISMVDTELILMGAIPAALLALVLDGLLLLLERRLTPKGVRRG
jgi:osmoprotectant transport system permease protein